MRSLALLAATFAIVFGSLLPSAVAASAATGSPVMLCSGDSMAIVYEADGTAKPRKTTPMDSLKCASCVLAAFTALPPPPPIYPAPAPRIVVLLPALAGPSAPPPAARFNLRPPSTAPPLA
jgi:hypothetical protein